MKKPTYLLLAFAATMLLYLAYPMLMITQAENTLTTGEVYRFKPRPVDPYDFMRGRYITLSYEQNSLDFPNAKAYFKNKQTVYLEVKEDNEGFAKIINAYVVKPDILNYLTADISRLGKEKIYFELPFNRYYLNEADAPIAERAYNDLIRQNRNDSTTVAAYMDVRISKGDAVIEELYLQDMPIREYLETLE